MADTFETQIKAYLDDRANSDELFAEKYIGSKKTVKECCAYIFQMARKQASNGAAAIADEVVYGWAVHFYQEDDIRAEMKANAAPVRVVKSDKPKSVKKAATNVDQLSLFSFDE